MIRKTFTFEGRRYSVFAETKEEAIAKAALKKRDLEEGRMQITKNMIVNNWFDLYVETYRRPSIGDGAYKDLLSQYKVWIKPNIGNLQLKDVKALQCQSILNKMNGKSKTHIIKIKQLLYGIFDVAMDNHLILNNPAKKLVIPKSESGTHRALTKQERSVLLQVADTNKYGLWVKVMLYCGLRPGETAYLMGQHIDLKHNKLYVDGTKTKAAKRWVPIPEPLVQDFHQIKLVPFQYLFTNANGSPINRTNRRRMWNSITRDMNILMGCKVFRNEVLPPFWVADDLVPYCLRHTYCTDLQAAGVPINIAKEFMGHSDISTTANIYTHSSDEAVSTAAASINAYQHLLQAAKAVK